MMLAPKPKPIAPKPVKGKNSSFSVFATFYFPSETPSKLFNF